MIEKKKTAPIDTNKFQSFFVNKQIRELLAEQVKEFEGHQLSDQFSISLIAQSMHLYIIFQRNKSTKTQNGTIMPEEFGAYEIKITKGFPVTGLRVHILNNCYRPRLFDCRDNTKQILGEEWTHKNRLVDILKEIDKFQMKLWSRDNKSLAMQKTGQFKMGDLFDEHQLKKFSSMDCFQDVSRENGVLLATTETHFLVFKNSPQPKMSGKCFQLVRACQLQCISDIYYNQEKEIILTINKYKKVKQFNEFEKISRKYKVQDSQQLIGNILKNIGQFQKVQTTLKLSPQLRKNNPVFDKINKRIEQAKNLQLKLQKKLSKQQKNEIYDQLVENYNKIIEYFSERANPYFNIFVIRLNKIYGYKATNLELQQ